MKAFQDKFQLTINIVSMILNLIHFSNKEWELIKIRGNHAAQNTSVHVLLYTFDCEIY